MRRIRTHSPLRPRSWRGAAGRACLGSAAGLLLFAVSAQGAELFRSGDLEVTLDTTLSHGVTVRVAKRDPDLLADPNGNDGDRNYGRELVSNTSKVTSDLDIRRGPFGAFLRVSGFVDFEHDDDLGTAQDGEDADILDAYVTGAFDVGETPLDLKLGRHVLNWGESTFIQNGVNVVNPVDVSRIRLPGAELREALLPVSMVSASTAPTDRLSVEGFYQLEWEKTEIDPVGSYFSVTDYVGPGAERAVISLPGAPIPDTGYGFGPLTTAINVDLTGQQAQPAFDPRFLNVSRGRDGEPGDSGQWGFALRYLAEELNSTEFGFFFVNHHSRLPLVSARAGTRQGVQVGLAAVRAVTEDHETDPNQRSATRNAIAAAVDLQVQAGLIDAADELAIIERQVQGIAQLLAIDRYAKTGSYSIEYPEDLQVLGLSFNTLLGASGWALQGEYSFRPDAPLQRSEASLFAEGLAPILRVLDPSRPDYIQPADVPAYLASYSPSRVQGYVERNVSQIQATVTGALGPVLGADGSILVAEVAMMHVHGMPDGAVTPLESPADGAIADATSWGYRLASRLDYIGAIGPMKLAPYLQFQHDVNGNSPSPSGSFVDGRTALTLGIGADYLSRWQADLGYTRYAGRRNELRDRDFIYASVKYSF